MEIFGIGGAEFVLILIIMMVVAGPKRMMTWAYLAGKWISKLKQMWAQTAATLQQELDNAGLDVKVPQQIPTRQSLNREIGKALSPYTRTLTEPLDVVKSEINNTRKTMTQPEPKGQPEAAESLGTWSKS